MKWFFTIEKKGFLEKFIYIFLFLLIIPSCGKSPVEKYQKAIEAFQEGTLDRVSLERSFFKAFGIEKPGAETLFFNKRVILNNSDEAIEIVFPDLKIGQAKGKFLVEIQMVDKEKNEEVIDSFTQPIEIK